MKLDKLLYSFYCNKKRVQKNFVPQVIINVIIIHLYIK